MFIKISRRVFVESPKDPHSILGHFQRVPTMPNAIKNLYKIPSLTYYMHHIKKIVAFGIFLVLAVASFLMIQPFFAGIFAALLIAFILHPLYTKLNTKFKKPGAISLILTTLTLIFLIIIVVIGLQITLTQVMSFYTYTKTTDITAPIKAIMIRLVHTDPTQFSFLFDTAVEKATSYILNSLNNLMFELPLIIMQCIVAFFTLFYFLKDGNEIINYFKSILPFGEDVKDKFINRFKEITSGVIYGSIIVGLFQGITAGIGFYLFGIDGAFVLTLIAIILSILPLGPWVLWIPIGINLIINGRTSAGIGLLVYGIVVVSYIDNIIKPYLIGNKIKLSPVITTIGMLGGAMVFGFMGIFVGPIILSYLILFLDFYKSSLNEII